MQTQRMLAQNMDYATILKKEAEANEIGDKEDAEYWHTVLMYRSHNYENLIPATIYSAGNMIGLGINIMDRIDKKLDKPNKIGFSPKR